MSETRFQFSGNSIQCDKKKDDEPKTVTDCKLGLTGVSTDLDMKALKCIKDQGSFAYRDLASKYLDLYQECLAKFDSCFYYEFENTPN